MCAWIFFLSFAFEWASGKNYDDIDASIKIWTGISLRVRGKRYKTLVNGKDHSVEKKTPHFRNK